MEDVPVALESLAIVRWEMGEADRDLVGLVELIELSALKSLSIWYHEHADYDKLEEICREKGIQLFDFWSVTASPDPSSSPL